MALFQSCKFLWDANKICNLSYAAFRIFTQKIVRKQQFDGKRVRLQLKFVARKKCVAGEFRHIEIGVQDGVSKFMGTDEALHTL